MFSSLVRFFQMGGFFMFPIVIVLAAGLAIALERWVHLKRVKDANKKTWDSIQPVLAKGEFD
ncbi:MAG: MotA/TolQ/ExbB proton channel family protein, partial [Deltaproteobacteria bacterium]